MTETKPAGSVVVQGGAAVTIDGSVDGGGEPGSIVIVIGVVGVASVITSPEVGSGVGKAVAQDGFSSLLNP